MNNETTEYVYVIRIKNLFLMKYTMLIDIIFIFYGIIKDLPTGKLILAILLFSLMAFMIDMMINIIADAGMRECQYCGAKEETKTIKDDEFLYCGTCGRKIIKYKEK